MQTLVNQDEKIRSLLDIVKKKRDFLVRDKEEQLKAVSKHFERIIRKIEERKGLLFQKVINLADKEIRKIDALAESLSAIKERSI